MVEVHVLCAATTTRVHTSWHRRNLVVPVHCRLIAASSTQQLLPPPSSLPMSSSRTLTPMARLALFRRCASASAAVSRIGLSPSSNGRRALLSRPFSSTISPSVLSSPVSVSSTSLSINYPPPPTPTPHPTSGPLPDTYFACNVFNRATVKRYLTPQDFTRYLHCLTHHQPIDTATADSIANALLRWATERGATHYTHWFQPITGTTAEKHDTFVDTMRDGDTPLLRFTGKALVMGEPDGSSFPSGGLRATHIARGYTAWDPNSPPFLLENGNGATLYIPSCFFSWDHGKALDEKIPLLRSEVALQREALRLFRIIGDDRHTHVHMDAGLEQEFFLIDRKYYLSRPDLMVTGRTVLGCSPPKGQELEDQYFGHISARVLDCIHEFEVECWKLGIPIQTRHREVAPGQYEIAPKFAPANVGTDRNLVLMLTLHKTARKHGLAALLHEKPFKGVNGSGKHNNWSVGSNAFPSLLNPGERPEGNALFMLFLAATIRAIDKHADLMRVAISGVGNDHRLGANEAPPAIVSVYLGDDIDQSVDRFIAGDSSKPDFDSAIQLGVSSLPNLHRVPTDRNRTSTFAFTGNKFEFRAVGSSHNPSRSNQVLNTIVAESVREMGSELEQLITAGTSTDDALRQVTASTLKAHRRVVFNGNGYSDEWQQEAARRGLPNFKSTPKALDTYYSEKNVALFESLAVLDRTELQARTVIMTEDYIKRLCIEVKVMVQLCLQSIAPVVVEYLLAVQGVEALGAAKGVSKVDGTGVTRLAKQLSEQLNAMLEGVEELKTKLHDVHSQESVSASAHYCEDQLIPAMDKTRAAADELEQIVPADKWPLPSYHQMLFHQD